MKKHISVLCLMARSSLYKILLLLAAMAILQTAVFWLYFSKTVTAWEAGLPMASLETLLPRSHITWIFAGAFFLLTFLLCRTGCHYGAQSGYTLDRLSVTPRSVWIWQAVYNGAAYLLFWGIEALIALGLCQLFVSHTDPTSVSQQTVFMALYRCEFLHTLLPLADLALWIRNGIFALSLGITSASFPYLQRRGKFAGELLAIVSFILVCFRLSPGEPGVSVIESAVVLIVSSYALLHISGILEEVET